ncbi:lipase secretion chaperone [Vibrio sinaloensis]|nr:lipase secretion chaperone [Vibrio sinaloensis]
MLKKTRYVNWPSRKRYYQNLGYLIPIKPPFLEQYIDTLPDYIKTTEQNNNLVADLISMDGLDEQQKLIVRTELVGENGAQRLAQLDQQRAQFQHTFDSYLEKKRATLLGSDQLSDQQKAATSECIKRGDFFQVTRSGVFKL